MVPSGPKRVYSMLIFAALVYVEYVKYVLVFFLVV